MHFLLVYWVFLQGLALTNPTGRGTGAMVEGRPISSGNIRGGSLGFGSSVLESGTRYEPTFFSVGSERFYVDPYKKVSWKKARKSCQELGAELARPTDVNKLRATLLDKFPEKRNQFFWLGAAVGAMGFGLGGGSGGGGGGWSSKSFARWCSKGQPDEGKKCVALSRDDEYPVLCNAPCNAPAMFICQAE